MNIRALESREALRDPSYAYVYLYDEDAFKEHQWKTVREQMDTYIYPSSVFSTQEHDD